MAPKDNDINKKDSWFKLPVWFNNMSKTSKTIAVLLTSTILILGVSSQVLSFGLDQFEKYQQIEINSKKNAAQDLEISNIKCLNQKKEKKADLKDAEKTFITIELDYVSKGIDIPSILKDKYTELPSEIETLKTEIKELNCSK